MRGPPPQHGAAALRFFGVILVAQKNWAQKTGHKKPGIKNWPGFRPARWEAQIG
jgi:hypothetical protein